MDEASSRFVDNLVMDKLVTEKLVKVNHSPTSDESELYSDLFSNFTLPDDSMLEILQSDNESFVFQSAIDGDFIENSKVPVKISSPEAIKKKARVILVHGLFEENRDIYTFLIQNLNRFGYEIYQTTLPFHYERKPAESSYGGEYFWSANIQRSRFAFRQGVAEIYQLYKQLKATDSGPVYIISFSMGGGVTMSLLSQTSIIDKVFLMNPTCSLSSIVWDSPLCKTIKHDLLNYGWNLDKIIEVYSYFDPATLLKDIDMSNTAMVYGIYDMITQKKQYQELINKLKLTNTSEYHCGHLNLLRVPKLAADIHAFFNKN